MVLMHNETSLDFRHKTLLAYCKQSIIETDLFEWKNSNTIYKLFKKLP